MRAGPPVHAFQAAAQPSATRARPLSTNEVRRRRPRPLGRGAPYPTPCVTPGALRPEARRTRACWRRRSSTACGSWATYPTRPCMRPCPQARRTRACWRRQPQAAAGPHTLPDPAEALPPVRAGPGPAGGGGAALPAAARLRRAVQGARQGAAARDPRAAPRGGRRHAAAALAHRRLRPGHLARARLLLTARRGPRGLASSAGMPGAAGCLCMLGGLTLRNESLCTLSAVPVAGGLARQRAAGRQRSCPACWQGSAARRGAARCSGLRKRVVPQNRRYAEFCCACARCIARSACPCGVCTSVTVCGAVCPPVSALQHCV